MSIRASSRAVLQDRNSLVILGLAAQSRSTRTSVRSSGEFEMLRQARAGDGKAASELYENFLKNSRPIMALLRSSFGNEEDRRDTLHDVYVQLVSGRNDFRGECRLSTYVFQVARFTIYQKYRRESTESRGKALQVNWDESVENSVCSTEGDPESLYQWKETREVIHRLIGQIPACYRHPLLLRMIEELSYRKIAERLHIPIKTVATRIHKGKKLLTALLQTSGREGTSRGHVTQRRPDRARRKELIVLAGRAEPLRSVWPAAFRPAAHQAARPCA
ncbi:MAG: sigma-70 family RNA polymerase sigma factor [Acidobacteriota bacterium]